MTTETLTEAPIYLIQTTGPYAIPHAWSRDADLVVEVRAPDGLTLRLAPGDWSVSPAAPDDSGDLTLTAPVAALHQGKELVITRETLVEQGWAGQAAREKGLEREIDRSARAVQDLRSLTERMPRLPRGAVPARPQLPAPEADRVLVGRQDGAGWEHGPSVDEVAAAQGYAQAAEAARDRAREWAESPEDTAVEPGHYSALHHAAKAGSHVAAAENARDLAQQYAADAAQVSGVTVPIYASVASAAGSTIAAGVKTIRTQHFAPTYGVPKTLVGGAAYSRVSLATITGAGYPAASYFRSQDRIMPDGTSDATNGGYWLLVVDSEIDIRMVGAVVDGLTNDADAVQAAVDYAAITGATVRFPAGKTLMGRVGASQVRHTALTGALRIKGVGAASVVQRAANTITSDFHRVFDLRNAPGQTASIEVSDLFFDDNARENGAPLTFTGPNGQFTVGETITGGTSGATARITAVNVGDVRITKYGSFANGETISGDTSGASAVVASAPSSYIWEHAATLFVGPQGLQGITSVVCDNLEFFDPVSDGIGIGGSKSNTIDRGVITRIRSSGRERVRSDITVTACWNELTISDVEVDRLEFETNSVSSSGSSKLDVVITNAIVRQVLDLAAEGAWSAGMRPRLQMSNVIVTGALYLSSFVANISDCHFTLNRPLRFVGGEWSIDACIFHWPGGLYNDGSSPYLFFHAGQPMDKLIVSNTEFIAEPHYCWNALSIGNVGGMFTVGEKITGGTSGAEAIVTDVVDDFAYIRASGPGNAPKFTAGETITGDTSGATAQILVKNGDVLTFFRDEDTFHIDEKPTEFINCKFHSPFIRAAMIRRGQYRFVGCEFNSNDYAIYIVNMVGSYTGANFIDVIGNTMKHPLGAIIRWRSGVVDDACEVRLRDNYAVSPGKIADPERLDYTAPPHGTAPNPAQEGFVILSVDDEEASQEPTSGKWLRGQRIWRQDATAGESMGWVCTNSGTAGSSATFKEMAPLEA